MKKCPFCAESIQDEAIKCKHCGEFLDGRPSNSDNVKWYFRPHMIVIAILTIGPFGLPLVWFHPKYTLKKKIIITLIVLAVTYFLAKATASAFKTLNEYYQVLLEAK